jgi:hypothetical protein
MLIPHQILIKLVNKLYRTLIPLQIVIKLINTLYINDISLQSENKIFVNDYNRIPPNERAR